jgi:hypothetical protein
MQMKRTVLVAGSAFAAALAYRRWVGPWQRHWGATAEEMAMPLPGDHLIPEPAIQVTRGITVAATPAEIWPWIVQLGADRGGFYSYDWLEDLFGLGIHSADEIIPDWQHLAPGDVVAADRRRSGGWYVVDLRPDEALVLQVADLKVGRPLRRDDKAGWEFQWTFALLPRGDDETRLLVRERVAFGSPLMRAVMTPIGPVSFVMTRRMLLGIRARAEGRRGTVSDVGDTTA